MVSSLISHPYTRYAAYFVAGAALLWLLRTPSGPSEGSVAPEFDLPLIGVTDAADQRVHLERSLEKPLLIEVFASWCGTCRRSAPALAQAHAKYGDKLDFLAVSVDEDQSAALRARRTWGIPYRVAHDERGSFARAYRIRVLPTFVLLDEQRHIARVSAGMPSPARLDEWANGLLE